MKLHHVALGVILFVAYPVVIAEIAYKSPKGVQYRNDQVVKETLLIKVRTYKGELSWT